MTTHPDTYPGLILGQPEEAAVTLRFYSYGCILTRRTPDGGFMEYAVNPADVAKMLSNEISLDTGLLGGDTLMVKQTGETRTVVGYRKPQRTGLYLEGSDEPLRCALPGLVMIRKLKGGSTPNYALYAVKRRPRGLNEKLYRAPLPNIFTSGAVCYGTVPMLQPDLLLNSSLDEDFRLLFGTPFGSHAVNGKSKKYGDVRELLIALDRQGVKRFPTGDLIDAKTTLGAALKGER